MDHQEIYARPKAAARSRLLSHLRRLLSSVLRRHQQPTTTTTTTTPSPFQSPQQVQVQGHDLSGSRLASSTSYTMSSKSIPLPSVLPSSKFYLACGTVTIDPSAHKLLCILDRHSNTLILPRGRKDWGEPLETTATRETFEESGLYATLLPLTIQTRATPPGDQNHPLQEQVARATFDSTGDVLDGGARVTEPFALMQHKQTNGALAVVSWYLATGDSTATPMAGTQMTDENYEAQWVRCADATRRLSDEMYREVVRLALELLERNGYRQGSVTGTGTGHGSGTRRSGGMDEHMLQQEQRRNGTVMTALSGCGSAHDRDLDLDAVVGVGSGNGPGPVLACSKVGIVGPCEREIEA